MADGGRAPDITIDMDARCAECGQRGRTPSGICLGCMGRIARGERMYTPEAKEVRRRFRDRAKGMK